MTSSSVLWVTPKWPFPANDGARIATVALIRDLVRRGVGVRLLSVVERALTEEDTAAAVRELGVIEAKGIVGDPCSIVKSGLLRPWLPLTMRRYAGSALDQFIQRESKRVSGIVYDGLHPAAHGSMCGVFRRVPSGPRIVYRAHNREAMIWERRAEQERGGRTLWGSLKGAAYAAQGMLVRRFEDSLARQSDLVATVSDEDSKLFQAVPGVKNVVTVPIGMRFPSDVPRKSDQDLSLRILFVGRLDWPPNREGLEWFLREVWPTLAQRRADASITIVGSGDGSWLSEYAALPRLVCKGRVPDTAPEYEAASLALIPVFYGGGTRVKAIEACRYGTPCISTLIGVEGIGLHDGITYIRAEERASWIEKLSSASSSDLQMMGARAFHHAKKVFSEEGCGKLFYDGLIPVLGE